MCALCTAVAIPAYLAFRNAVSHDEAAPPADDDLRAQWRNVGRADNGYFLVAFLDPVTAKLNRKQFTPPPEWPAEDSEVHGESGLFDPKVAGILLDQNSSALKRFAACLETDDFVVPSADPSAPSASQTTLVHWKNLGRLVRCRSRYFYETGERTKALDEALTLVRFGHLVAHSQAGLGAYLVGCQLSHWGINSIVWLINEGEHRAADLAAITAALPSYLERGFGLEESFRTEYTLTRGTIDGWARSMAHGHGVKTQGLVPETLDELVPTYLEAVPADPADGKPIRYLMQKKIVYSIGSGREDGGGSQSSGVKEALADVVEPTFRIQL